MLAPLAIGGGASCYSRRDGLGFILGLAGSGVERVEPPVVLGALLQRPFPVWRQAEDEGPQRVLSVVVSPRHGRGARQLLPARR